MNMITLKKFHPDAPAPTHEVTKDIDLKQRFNVVKSKQRTLNELKTHYDSLVSFEEVKENFLSRQEEFPMETQLNMNHNSITNLKDPQFDREAATKFYADKKLALSGGEMFGVIDMGGNRITNAAAPSQDSDVAIKGYADLKLSKSGGRMEGSINMGTFEITNLAEPTGNASAATKRLADSKLSKAGGIMTGAINMGWEKISNLKDPIGENDAANKSFVEKKISEEGISSTSHAKDEFRFLMEDVDESSSESGVAVTGIVDFQQSPHKFNKKAYALKIDKRSSDNLFIARLGFNMFRIPEGEFTICVEFFPGRMNGVSVNAVSTSLNVTRQATKKFAEFSRSIIHIHKWKISPPEFLMLDLKWQGTAEDSSPGDAHLIIYGVKEFQANVESAVFDAPFIFENSKMLMQTGLNMNGHDLIGNRFCVVGKLKVLSNSTYFTFDELAFLAFPVKVKLIKAAIINLNDSFSQVIDLNIEVNKNGVQTFSGRNVATVEFNLGNGIEVPKLKKIRFFAQKGVSFSIHDLALLSLVFEIR